MTDLIPTRRELADIARRRHVKEAHHAAQHARGNEMAWWRSIGLDPFTTAEGLFNTFNGERP